MTSMLDENGATQSSEQDILDVFASLHEKLFKAKARRDDVNDDDITHVFGQSVPKTIPEEVSQKQQGARCEGNRRRNVEVAGEPLV